MRWCHVSNPDWFYHYISFPDCSLSSHAESPTIHYFCVHTHPFKIFQRCWVNKAALKCISYLRLIKSLALVQEAVHKMKHPGLLGDDWFSWFPLLTPPLLYSLAVPMGANEHLKTIKRIDAQLDLKTSNWCTYSTMERVVISVGSWHDDSCRVIYLSQRGFRSGVRHTPQRIIFLTSTGINSTCAC